MPLSTFLHASLLLAFGASAQDGLDTLPSEAAPRARQVVIEGVVADAATKARLLASLGAVYGSGRIVDRVQVDAVTASPNWGQYAAAMISRSLTQVTNGRLDINGQAVHLTGEVASEARRTQLMRELSLASNASYTVTDGLQILPGQAALDSVLANRTIAFKTNSAELTVPAMRILDELAVPLGQAQGRHLLVVGHTDNIGQPAPNVALSLARAMAVKYYLTQKGIPSDLIETRGRGADEPIADNGSAEGRTRNRRIEFRIL